MHNVGVGLLELDLMTEVEIFEEFAFFFAQGKHPSAFAQQVWLNICRD